MIIDNHTNRLMASINSKLFLRNVKGELFCLVKKSNILVAKIAGSKKIIISIMIRSSKL
ncbi:hypothetical protein [Apibacter muscae]|nr:hypothetical protein [Apibacter muscae]